MPVEIFRPFRADPSSLLWGRWNNRCSRRGWRPHDSDQSKYRRCDLKIQTSGVL